MNLELLLVSLIPIVLFVVIELRYGVKAGVVTAMAAAVALGGYLYFRFGELDSVYLVEVLLILGLGGLAIKMQKSQYFKLQPMIVGLVFAAYIFGMQIFSDPYLIRMLPIMGKMLPPEQLAQFQTPQMMAWLRSMSWQSGVLILAHGLACGYAAYKFSSWGWLAMRMAIYPAFLALVIGSRLSL